MSLKISKIAVISLLSFGLLISSCGGNLNIFGSKNAEINKIVSLHHPLTLVMPSANYNQRPENTKIDTIIIHHTAPFASLTRVGYFFQDVNSRVSAHYTVGKEGLIIESVDEKDRAWQAGGSSWLGKYNVNDYSVGIEVLNDGDNKDPFTEPQYNSLANLVAYLMKKYNIPLSRVIGHRDIALPLGRKIDPADNFNWKLFKAKIRSILGQPPSFFGWGELPQESNISLGQIKKYLYSASSSERSLAIDSLLTVDYKQIKNSVEEAFNKETDPVVKAKFFRLFEIYEDKNYLESARKIFQNYFVESPLLISSVVNYLYAVDKENSKELFFNTFTEPNLSGELKYTLIRVMSNFKDENITKSLLERLNSSTDTQEKKIIIESFAKFEDKALNNTLLSYLEGNNPDDLKATAIETLRVTFDENVENKLIEILKSENLAQNVLEAITWTLLRKDSKKGITLLQQENIYNQLSPKLQIGLFNTIGKLKITDSEDWLINKTDKVKDETVKASSFLALGRMQGEKSFAYLYKNLKDNLSLNFILFKALSTFDKPEVTRAISQILVKDNIPFEVKLLAVSTIKEKKMSQLLPQLKALYVENRNPDLDMVIEDTIQSFEPKSEQTP